MIDGIGYPVPQWVKDVRLVVSRLTAVPSSTRPTAILIRPQAVCQNVWAGLLNDLGGSTVSFDRLARRLVNCLQVSTSTVRASVTSDPSSIDLGAPDHMCRAD